MIFIGRAVHENRFERVKIKVEGFVLKSISVQRIFYLTSVIFDVKLALWLIYNVEIS